MAIFCCARWFWATARRAFSEGLVEDAEAPAVAEGPRLLAPPALLLLMLLLLFCLPLLAAWCIMNSDGIGVTIDEADDDVGLFDDMLSLETGEGE